jgi:hypothetical protein
LPAEAICEIADNREMFGTPCQGERALYSLPAAFTATILPYGQEHAVFALRVAYSVRGETLRWIWLYPYCRTKAILTGIWSELREKHGDRTDDDRRRGTRIRAGVVVATPEENGCRRRRLG